MQDGKTLKIIGAKQIEKWLNAHATLAFDLTRDVYLAQASGKTVNPDSFFLRFPDSDRNRIIALTGSLEDADPVAGIKWIASFPQNVDQGLNRASAVLILNDRQTGYPFACLEGSVISAARTAASAAVGAHYLHTTPKRAKRIGVVGCGLIAFSAIELLKRLDWQIDEIVVYDLSRERAELFQKKVQVMHAAVRIADLQETISTSDMVLFGTSAVKPFVDNSDWFHHHPTVLHMSLRDLATNIVLSAQNVADNVEHCMKAQTSIHLAEQETGNRDFMAGDIASFINGSIVPNPDQTRVYSPFGMGVLDLALGRAIVHSLDSADIVELTDFFPIAYVA